MAIRTKLNTKENETSSLDVLDDLDAAYVSDLKESGIDERLLEQFADITKMLEEEKQRKR